MRRRCTWLLYTAFLAGCGLGTPGTEADTERPAPNEQAQRLHAVCTAQHTYDRLKALLFDDALRIRGGNGGSLDQLMARARAELAEPVTASAYSDGAVVVCSGRLVLELPADGAPARRYAAPVEYAAQASPDGSGLIFEMHGAEAIAAQLAGIPGPVPASAPQEASQADPPYDGEERARHSTGPSFDCAQARPGVEATICSSASLSQLDRRMASLYYDQIARAGPRTRGLLRRTRDGFLARRDRCQQPGCIASVYEDRISELGHLGSPG